MDVCITPKVLSGTVIPPSSKSMAHRAILAAALGSGTSVVQNVSFSKDIEATLRCVAAFRCDWERVDANTLKIHGLHGRERDPAQISESPFFDCGESGSTLRFLIPIALALCGGGRFTGQGRLMDRPQKPYFDIFDQKGISYRQRDGVLTVEGELPSGIYSLPGDVSSQFVTGLLYALPLLGGDSEIVLTSPLESGSYVEMTLQMLDAFGIKIGRRGYERFTIPGGQIFSSRKVTVEGDWSQAGFWYAAKKLGNPVEIAGMEENSAQGDRVVAEHFSRLCGDGDLTIDLSDCPDLLPPLAVMAAVRRGITRFTGAARLRLKESDRLATVHALLSGLGGLAEEGPDFLLVTGQPALKGGTVDGANDHRIVMAAAIAATACREPVTILGAEAVEKSYPAFWQNYKDLGGGFNVL